MRTYLRYLAFFPLWACLVCAAQTARGETLKGEGESNNAVRTTAAEDVDQPKRNMIEFYVNREFITDGFGNWDSGGMRYTRNDQGYSWYMEANGYNRSRSGGAAPQVVGGLYKDWSDWFYTFTSMSTGGDVEYLPEFRVDQDLNFKLLEQKNLVWTLGGSYIKYHTPSENIIYSSGLTYYHPGIILGYRYFYNISNPGGLTSSSHSVSVDQGYWYRYMNTLVYSWGNQAYKATYLEDPSDVERKSQSLMFRHRNWIGKDWGVWGQAGVLKMKNGYDGTNLGFGVFFYY